MCMGNTWKFVESVLTTPRTIFAAKILKFISILWIYEIEFFSSHCISDLIILAPLWSCHLLKTSVKVLKTLCFKHIFSRRKFWNITMIYHGCSPSIFKWQTGDLYFLTCSLTHFALSLIKKALHWTPESKRKRVDPKFTSKHCRDRDDGFAPQLELHPKTERERTTAEVLCCCPVCQWAWPAGSEWVSDSLGSNDEHFTRELRHL